MIKVTGENAAAIEEAIADIVRSVVSELRSANRKYPLFNSSHEAMGVILEEWEELKDEIKANRVTENGYSTAEEEAIQLAAMAIKFILSENVRANR
ncbi:MAG: hypothetical protein PHS46_08330 [Candidatus Omnitrophica bacterium]|nr:hypothetical protein [Candidatus Omnitrophota bacterium]